MNLFGDLIKSSWKFCKSYAIPILVGAIAFAVVLLVVRDYFEQKTNEQIRIKFLKMGIPDKRYEELNDRMKQGDKSAFDELKIEMINVNRKIDNMSDIEMTRFYTQQGKEISLALLQIVITFSIIIILIYLFEITYFLVLSSTKTKNTLKSFKYSIRKFLPMLGLFVWIFIRSFIFILLPRFIFSGIILIKENRSITDSAKESYIQTKGKGLSILIQYIMLIVFILIIVSATIFVIPFSGFIGKIINLTIWNLGLAFVIIFTIQYADKLSITKVIKNSKNTKASSA